MKVIQSYTGIWHSPMFGPFTIEVMETISIIQCDDLYLLIRVSDVKSENSAVSETKYTRSYTEALAWYEEWNKALMWHISKT